MRTLAIKTNEDGGVLTLTLPEDLAVTCVVAVKDAGLFAAAPGEPVRLQPEGPLPWEQLRKRAEVVVTTPKLNGVKPLRCAVRAGDPETAEAVADDVDLDPVRAIRELAALIPRKRPLR